MVYSRDEKELNRRNRGSEQRGKVLQIHHELRGDLDGRILQFIILLHLVYKSRDDAHETFHFLLLRLSSNREHDTFPDGTWNHIAYGADREVDSLQVAPN